MSENDVFDLVGTVLQTLRWYLAEQQCLTDDNRVLFDTFSEIFPPTIIRTYVPLPKVQVLLLPVTVERLLQWLEQVYISKSNLTQAYIEFFDNVSPMATGKIHTPAQFITLYGDISYTLRDFIARQQPYVLAVREACDTLARVLPVGRRAAAAAAAHALRQLPRPQHATATYSYVERFLDRLKENLDAEQSLDAAHLKYCSLVSQHAVRRW